MSDDKSNTRIQIIVAVIGLGGVLGAAVIANWDKIFPSHLPPGRPIIHQPSKPLPTDDSPSSGKTPANAESLVGKWKNENPQTDGITRVEISDRLGVPRFHLWGKCHPDDCDIGDHPLFVGDGKDNAISFDFIANTIHENGNLILLGDGKLQMILHTMFGDKSGRPNYGSTFRFVRG